MFNLCIKNSLVVAWRNLFCVKLTALLCSVIDSGEDSKEQARRQQRGSRAQISLQHQTLFEGAVHWVSEWCLQCCHVPCQGKRINKEFFTQLYRLTHRLQYNWFSLLETQALDLFRCLLKVEVCKLLKKMILFFLKRIFLFYVWKSNYEKGSALF